MIAKYSIILLLPVLVMADGRSHGRKGNQAYEAERYAEAADSYRAGLNEEAENGSNRFHFGLLNNLASSQYRLDNAQEALRGFVAAAESATGVHHRAAARYNAGNAAYRLQDLERALAHYRQALLENPGDQDAKFNYEFVKRKIEDQPEGGEQGSEPDDDSQRQEDQQESGDQPQEEQDGQDGDEGSEDQDQPSEPDQGEQDSDGQQPDEQEERPQETRPQDSPQRLSQEEAQRILQALESEEEKLLREVQRVQTPARRVEKDW